MRTGKIGWNSVAGTAPKAWHQLKTAQAKSGIPEMADAQENAAPKTWGIFRKRVSGTGRDAVAVETAQNQRVFLNQEGKWKITHSAHVRILTVRIIMIARAASAGIYGWVF